MWSRYIQRKDLRIPRRADEIYFSLGSQPVKTGGGDCYFRYKGSKARTQGTLKNEGNLIPPKEHNNFLLTRPQNIKIYGLLNKKKNSYSKQVQ